MEATIDLNKQAQPFFIYQRLRLKQPIAFLNFKIDQGFKFELKRLFIKSAERVEMFIDNFDEGYVEAQPVRIELLDNAKNKTRQNTPIPISLISSPNNANVTQFFTYASRHTSLTTGIELDYNFTASSSKKSALLDYEYVNGDVIQIRITGTPIPEYFIVFNHLIIDVMLQGYYVFDERAMS
jgi:hypothetical protein